MKKYILLLVVFALVLSSVLITSTHPTWASMLPASMQPGDATQPAVGVNSNGVYAPPATLITITGNGIYDVGGVCTIEVEFKGAKLKIIADAEVPIVDSQKVRFEGPGDLFFPGCHFVYYNQGAIVDRLQAKDGSATVCFGANPYMRMTIYYYQDNPAAGIDKRHWIPLPTTLEDNGRLACAPAEYTGVYMPTGRFLKQAGEVQPGTNPLFPNGLGGSVLPPPSKITITGSGTFAVGGICLITTNYTITGLSDIVEVFYPSEDTLKIPSDALNGAVFYFPGCRVTHYLNQIIQDQMTSQQGDWQICFAAIPGKTMEIFYYEDNLTNVTSPWTALATTTANGMACAKLVDFSGVYIPTGK